MEIKDNESGHSEENQQDPEYTSKKNEEKNLKEEQSETISMKRQSETNKSTQRLEQGATVIKVNESGHSGVNQKDPENPPKKNEEKNLKEEQLDKKSVEAQSKTKDSTNGWEHKHKKHLIKPGNRKYLSHYNYQERWKCTRSLCPIAAEARSPGPAIVNLPSTIGDHNHDPRRSKAPAFKLGKRDFLPSCVLGPGPAGYDTRKLTNKGKDKCNAVKIGDKCNPLLPYITPGPAAYGSGDSDNLRYPHAPAFSMMPKTQVKKMPQAPAPNLYTLSGSLGPGKAPNTGGPAYSIRKLEQVGAPSQSPGPASYELPSTNINRQKPPAFSMGSRHFSQMSGPVTPGPASNDFHLVKFHKFSTPRFSFGMRHSPHKAFQAFATGD